MNDFDFASEVQSLDAVPDTFRPLYEEREGKYVLNDLIKRKVSDTNGLKSAYERTKEEARKYQKQARALEELGKTPEEIRELLDRAAQHEQAEAERKGEWDKLRQQMVDKHTKQLESVDNEKKALRQTLERYLVEAEATRLLAEAKGNATVLLPHVKNQTRVVEENGEYHVRVVDAKGDPRVDASGNYLTIKDLVTEMHSSDVFGCAFQGTGATGSGMLPNNSGGGKPTVYNPNKMTQADKAEFISEHGLDAYYKLLSNG